MSEVFVMLRPTSVVITDKQGKIHTITNSHMNYEQIRNAIKARDFDAALALVDVVKGVEEYGQGAFTIKDDTVFYKGQPLHGTAVSRMLALRAEGFDVTPLLNFLAKLQENPDYRAVTHLYDFMEASNLPLTQDGDFIAYKRVTNGFLDIHTRTMDNSVGMIVEMPRNKVNPDPDQTCSHGLHVCSQEYLPHFGSAGSNTVVLCKINPRDVVAIPRDYNNAKMRVCRYEVYAEVGNEQEAIDAVRKSAVFQDKNGVWREKGTGKFASAS